MTLSEMMTKQTVKAIRKECSWEH